MKIIVLLVAFAAGCQHLAAGGDDLGDTSDAALAIEDADLASPDLSIRDLSLPGDGSVPPDGSTPPIGDFCVEDGWCWQRPTPFGVSLFAAWGSAPDDVWAAGAGGTLVHFDGQKWQLRPSGFSADLEGLWGASKDDVWAVGSGGTILHFDGSAWTSLTSPTTKDLHGVHGTATADVYAVGDEDTRLHWDGASWTALPTLYPMAGTRPAQHGVWASADGEVWSAGQRWLEAIPHRSGGVWTTTQVDYVSGPTVFKTVWGASSSDVWMSGDPGGQGSLQRWNGSKWTNVYPPTDSLLTSTPIAITGSGPNDVWFFGGWYANGRWNGSAFVAHPELQYEYLNGGWVHPSGAGWAVGYGGRMARKDTLDGAFSFVGGSPAGGYDTLAHVFVLAEDDAWVVGRLSTAHWNGQAWTDVAAAPTTYRQEFDDVWGSGPNDVWATAWGSASPNNLQHWNGSAWTTTPHPGPSELDAVWGASANDVWVAYAGGGMRWDGVSWTEQPSGPGGSAMHGTAADDIWSVGVGGKIRRWNGTSWAAVPSGTSEDLGAVLAFSKSDAVVSGENATLRRWNGSSWEAFGAPPISLGADGRRSITALAGTSATDLWASTSSGEVFHRDAAGWTRSARLAVGVYSLARTPAGALFAAGGNGAVLRRAP